ncbi:uncharacterized protein LOC135214899 [Macrobrachium nipponense]|uniref:uncharacterized protein LOC135214899 n=1 Tax=Macrobrachium nipponense TaxID=159736 RepID=UPI0030C89599
MSPLRNHTTSCEKRQNHFDLAVKDLSRLLNRLCVTPRTKPRRMKPLGVACGKMRYSRGGARRKMFIDVNRKKDSRHTARGIPSHSSSFLYLQSKFEESHREPGKKTLRSTRRRNPSLSSRGFILSASRRPKSNVVNGNESDKRQISRVPVPESELPQSPTRSSYRGTLTSVSSKSEQSQCYVAKSSVPCPLVASREIVSPNDDAGPNITPDRNLASRGQSGSPAGGTTRQSSHRGQSSNRTNLEFTAYMNKRVIAKIAGGRWVEGTLRGYDSYMNLVLEDTVELRSTGERIPVGVAVIRGRSIAMVEEAAEGVSAGVIIHRSGFHERKPLKTIQLDEE